VDGFSRQEGAVLWLAQIALELMATTVFNNYIFTPFPKPNYKPFETEMCDRDDMSRPNV